MEPVRFEFQSAPLQGFNLIEASAGTGKTWTLSALYVRALVEKRLNVEQILVVTFTTAATAELATRMRARLIEVQGVLRGGSPGEDVLLQYVADRFVQGADALSLRALKLHVEYCLLNFDQAAIFTIHSFSQRVLTDFAFTNQQALNMALQQDTSMLVNQLLQDFWRQRFYTAPPEAIFSLLQQSWFTPEYFATQMKLMLGRPDLQVPETQFEWQGQRLWTLLQDAWQRACGLWRDQHAEIGELLALGPDRLHKRVHEAQQLLLPGLTRFFSSDYNLFNPNSKLKNFSRTVIDKGTVKGKDFPEHEFFTAIDDYLVALERFADYLKQLRDDILFDAFHFVSNQLDETKRKQKSWGFDDLLLNLRRVLDSPLAGELVQAVAGRYRVALIDEFQDTDPVQYQNIRDLFAERADAVFLVGDPKQAIYSFRGADLFTYLSARADVDNLYFIDTNYRSVPELVAAVNHLFERQIPPAFVQPGLRFFPSKSRSGSQQDLQLKGEPVVPFNFIQPLCSEDENHCADRIQQQVLDDTAARIRQMLLAGREGSLTIEERPFRASDIAILVRTHAQAAEIKQHMLARGIACSLLTQSSVLHADEAGWIELLLQQMRVPHDIALLKSVLMLPFFEVPADSLFKEDEVLDRWLAAFYQSHQLWQDQGVFVALTEFLAANGLREALRAMPDGERVLTNIHHLIEILHRQEVEAHAQPDSLLKWYEEMRQEDNSRHPDYAQLRLESESDLIKIVTIHASKGLEYPVVFCPFVWKAGSGRLGDYYIYHDDDNQLGLADSRADDEIKQYRRREDIEEGLRVLYVALTRARNACYVYWAKQYRGSYGDMAWLLHPASSLDKKDTDKVWKKLNQDGVAGVLSGYEQQHPGLFRYHWLDHTQVTEADLSVMQADMPSLSLRTFTAVVKPAPGRLSFSALLRRTGSHGPDYDALAEQVSAIASVNAIPDYSSAWEFPRGAIPGECLHQIFELADFTTGAGEVNQQVVRAALERFAIDEQWTPAALGMLDRTLNCPLNDGDLHLGKLTHAARLNELRFDYRVNAFDGQALLAAMREDSLLAEYARHTLDAGRFAGLMTGFIDLVFESDGRFYIADYKSNWLGRQVEDYGQAQMMRVMQQEAYYLQYMIYVIALHRYLRQRLPDYDYARHFGGVYYLFVRACGQGKQGEGVYYHLPEQNVVEQMDALLEGAYA